MKYYRLTLTDIVGKQFGISYFLFWRSIRLHKLNGYIQIKLRQGIHNNFPSRTSFPGPGHCVICVSVSDDNGLDCHSRKKCTWRKRNNLIIWYKAVSESLLWSIIGWLELKTVIQHESGVQYMYILYKRDN